MALSIGEFCDLVNIARKRYGPDVMVSPSAGNRMQLSLHGENLGYIDIVTGSLVWLNGVTEYRCGDPDAP